MLRFKTIIGYFKSIACSSVHFLSRKQTMNVKNCSGHDQVNKFFGNKMVVKCKIVARSGSL